MTSYSNKTVARTFFSTYFTILNTMSIVNIRTIWKRNSIIGPDDIVQHTMYYMCMKTVLLNIFLSTKIKRKKNIEVHILA